MNKVLQHCLITIPGDGQDNIKVEWPLVGTQGVVVEESVEITELAIEQMEKIAPDWLSEMVPGGIFVDAEPEQLFNVRIDGSEDVFKSDLSLELGGYGITARKHQA